MALRSVENLEEFLASNMTRSRDVELGKWRFGIYCNQVEVFLVIIFRRFQFAIQVREA